VLQGEVYAAPRLILGQVARHVLQRVDDHGARPCSATNSTRRSGSRARSNGRGPFDTSRRLTHALDEIEAAVQEWQAVAQHYAGLLSVVDGIDGRDVPELYVEAVRLEAARARAWGTYTVAALALCGRGGPNRAECGLRPCMRPDRGEGAGCRPAPKQKGRHLSACDLRLPSGDDTHETVSMETRSANVLPQFADFCSRPTSNLLPSTALRGHRRARRHERPSW
jgi:hypothetical protein